MLRNNIRKILVFIVATIIFLALLITYIKSNDDKNKLGTIHFLGNENIAPIVYDENGLAQGVAVDLVKALGDKIGYRVEIEVLNWVEAQNMVLAGEADALIQVNPSPEREKLYDFSDELLETEFSIFTSSGNVYIKTLDDLINRTVGVEEGGYAYNLLQRYDGIRIVEIPSTSYGFHMIKSGTLDAIVADRWIGEYELAQSSIERVQVVDQPIERQYSSIAVKKGNKELLDLINLGLREIKADSTMNKVINNWKGKKVLYFTEEMIIRIALYTSIGVIIVIILIGTFLVTKYIKLSKKLEMDVEERTKELYEANELLRKANMELESISITDKITNVYNRRFLDISLEEAWSIAKREKLTLALIMIDVDMFKEYNDTYGHLAGDKCLNSIANEIRKVIRDPEDFVARYGGEEFAVLLHNTSVDEARILAEKIRVRVENLDIHSEDIETRVTVSLGVATIRPDGSNNPNNLINIADEALYQAKEAGRNQAIYYFDNK